MDHVASRNGLLPATDYAGTMIMDFAITMTPCVARRHVFFKSPTTMLVKQLESLDIPVGQLAIWSLGQFGLLIKGGQTILAVDPYLSNSLHTRLGGPIRMFPPPVPPNQLSAVQHVLITHEHADHYDPDTLLPIAEANERAQFHSTHYCAEMLVDAGVPRARARRVTAGQTYDLGAARVTPTPAAHYEHDDDPVKGNRWLGFVIELNGCTLYHSGDTILFPALLKSLAPWRDQIDVACLPVNGRDYWRDQVGVIGNLDGTEALELCAHLHHPVLIPMHNDLFAGNHVSPAVLAEYQDRKYPRQRYHWLQPGELYLFVK